MNVGGVGIDPEVMALRVTIEVQAQAVATHLTANKNQRQVSAGWRLPYLSWSSLQSQGSSASRFPEY